MASVGQFHTPARFVRADSAGSCFRTTRQRILWMVLKTFLPARIPEIAVNSARREPLIGEQSHHAVMRRVNGPEEAVARRSRRTRCAAATHRVIYCTVHGVTFTKS